MTTDEDFSKTSTLKEKEKIQLYRYFQKFKAVEIKKERNWTTQLLPVLF